MKRQARVFKSVLKLDKNFHIYIHGDRDRIERGVDERTGRKFYKIYYDEESLVLSRRCSPSGARSGRAGPLPASPA